MPPFWTVFDTFGKNGVNKGPLRGVTVGDQVPHLCPQSTSHEALIWSDGARVSKIMPREGVGVALGAQVRHVVTYRNPPEGTLIYTIFTKKYQKRSTKGVPQVLDRF